MTRPVSPPGRHAGPSLSLMAGVSPAQTLPDSDDVTCWEGCLWSVASAKVSVIDQRAGDPRTVGIGL